MPRNERRSRDDRERDTFTDPRDARHRGDREVERLRRDRNDNRAPRDGRRSGSNDRNRDDGRDKRRHDDAGSRGDRRRGSGADRGNGGRRNNRRDDRTVAELEADIQRRIEEAERRAIMAEGERQDVEATARDIVHEARAEIDDLRAALFRAERQLMLEQAEPKELLEELQLIVRERNALRFELEQAMVPLQARGFPRDAENHELVVRYDNLLKRHRAIRQDFEQIRSVALTDGRALQRALDEVVRDNVVIKVERDRLLDREDLTAEQLRRLEIVRRELLADVEHFERERAILERSVYDGHTYQALTRARSELEAQRTMMKEILRERELLERQFKEEYVARTELEREARTRGESATPMLIGEVQQMKIRLQELQAESHQATQAKEAEIYALQTALAQLEHDKVAAQDLILRERDALRAREADIRNKERVIMESRARLRRQDEVILSAQAAPAPATPLRSAPPSPSPSPQQQQQQHQQLQVPLSSSRVQKRIEYEYSPERQPHYEAAPSVNISRQPIVPEFVPRDEPLGTVVRYVDAAGRPLSETQVRAMMLTGKFRYFDQTGRPLGPGALDQSLIPPGPTPENVRAAQARAMLAPPSIAPPSIAPPSIAPPSEAIETVPDALHVTYRDSAGHRLTEAEYNRLVAGGAAYGTEIEYVDAAGRKLTKPEAEELIRSSGVASITYFTRGSTDDDNEAPALANTGAVQYVGPSAGPSNDYIVVNDAANNNLNNNNNNNYNNNYNFNAHHAPAAFVVGNGFGGGGGGGGGGGVGGGPRLSEQQFQAQERERAMAMMMRVQQQQQQQRQMGMARGGPGGGVPGGFMMGGGGGPGPMMGGGPGPMMGGGGGGGFGPGYPLRA